LLVVSDGVTETGNAENDDEEFGEEGSCGWRSRRG
jgi:hypothetical protein